MDNVSLMLNARKISTIVLENVSKNQSSVMNSMLSVKVARLVKILTQEHLLANVFLYPLSVKIDSL